MCESDPGFELKAAKVTRTCESAFATKMDLKLRKHPSRSSDPHTVSRGGWRRHHDDARDRAPVALRFAFGVVLEHVKGDEAGVSETKKLLQPLAVPQQQV